MKYIKIVALVFFILSLGTACKKDCNTSTSALATEPITGSWRVSSFVKDSVDLTNQFNGYMLNCNNNGSMMVQGNGGNYNWTWNWNDANHTVCNFRIMGCDKNSILWEMDEDWNFTRFDSSNCYFSNMNTTHHSSMKWIKN